MRLVTSALVLMAAACCAPVAFAGSPALHEPRVSRDEVRLVGVAGANASPAALNRLARKNSRARQTKRGKRGKR